MTLIERILASDAPAPIGPYSQAVRAGSHLFCSGVIAIDPATGKLIDGDIEAQTRRVLENLRAVLAAAGCSFDTIVKTTIYLVDMADFAVVNAVYGERFGNVNVPPARATVAVAALPLGARVEIEAIAVLQ